jgi:DNA replication protein
MIEFKGFPARMQFTPIPNIVFSSLLPQINDITELKVLLHIFEVIYPKKGNVRFVSYSELLSHSSLIADLKDPPEPNLHKTLGSLVDKRVILSLHVSNSDIIEDIYFLNNETNKLTIERIRNGEVILADIKLKNFPPVAKEEPPDIFTLYEQNIGMLTPLIAEELKEAGKQYPETWIKDAIKEAVASNKRSWRYLARILEHWAAEGKGDGTHRGNLKTNTDPDKYIRGKYGHMVQR